MRTAIVLIIAIVLLMWVWKILKGLGLVKEPPPTEPPVREGRQLTKHQIEVIARAIHSAIEGFGTDERALYRALLQIPTDDDFIAVMRTYNTMFESDLIDDLRSELSSEEIQTVNYIFRRNKLSVRI